MNNPAFKSSIKNDNSSSHVPYSGFSDAICETWLGTLVSAFSIKPYDIECSDEEQLRGIAETLSRILNALNDDFIYSFIAQKNETSGKRTRFSVWIQSIPQLNAKWPQLKTLGIISNLDNSRNAEMELFLSGVGRLQESLQSSAIGHKQLRGFDLKELIGEFFTHESNLSSIPRSDLIIQENYFHYDHHVWGAVSISEFPDQIATGQIAEVLGIQCDSIFVLKLIPQSSEKIVEQLKRKRKVTASLSVTNSRLKDMESEAKLQSEEELLDGLIVGQEKVFECQTSIIVSAKNQDKLSANLREISHSLKSFGYQVYREAISLYPVFQACLPGSPIEKNRTYLLPTSCVQALIPIYDIDFGHDHSIIKFKNRFDGDVSIDPWDQSLTSYNSVISGTSGSGKSFLSNVLLKRLVEKVSGISVFIIDIGGSYRRQTILQGGQFITFDVQGANGFNPFGNLRLEDPSSLEAATDILCAVLGDVPTGVGKYERNVLLQQLCEVLSESKDEITFSTLRKRWASSEIPFLKNAAVILYGWTEDRAYGRLVDNTKSLDTNNKWVCFDLRGLNDHVELQRVVMLSVVKRLWDIIRYSDEKKILILDEVWALIQNHSSFIGEAFRTFRKHNASAIAITQSLEDIATESLTAAVLNNTPTKIILKQSLKPERLQSLLNLNAKELGIVGGLRSVKGQYSEFFMINGDKHRFLKLCPTPEDYWISTTNPTDLDFIKTFMTTHPELTELQACHQIAKNYGKDRP